jgi:hypothetical protein
MSPQYFRKNSKIKRTAFFRLILYQFSISCNKLNFLINQGRRRALGPQDIARCKPCRLGAAGCKPCKTRLRIPRPAFS